MSSGDGGRYTSFTNPPSCSRLNSISTHMSRNDGSDNGGSSTAILSSHSFRHRSMEWTEGGETSVLRNQGSTMHTNAASSHGGNAHHESTLACATAMSIHGLHPNSLHASDVGGDTKSSTSATTVYTSSAPLSAFSIARSSSGGGAGLSPFSFIPCEDPPSAPYSLPTSEANAMLLFGFPWYAREKEIDSYLRRVYPTTPPLTTRLYTFPHNGVSRGICYVEYPVEVEVRKRGGASSFSLANATEDHHPYGRRRQRMGTAVSSLHRFTGHSAVSASSSSSNSAFTTAVDVVRVDYSDIQQRIMANPWDTTITLLARCYYLPMNAPSANHWDRTGTLPPLPMDLPLTKPLVGYGEQGRSVRCGASLELPNTCTSAEAHNRVEMCRKRLRRVFSANNKAHLVPNFSTTE